jgi:CRP-like cAMP-binding protein
MAAPESVDRLAQLTLFSDLRWPELEAVAHTFDEEVFAAGQRVLRQGISGGAFYVVLEGEAAVVIDGQERARLGRGEFFGEVSVLTGGVPIADVRAETLLRCLVLPGPQLERFLLEHPAVMLRMLQSVSRRLRDASRWS